MAKYLGSSLIDKLAMDGTTSVVDNISGAAFTKTGGVSNAWTESSNFRTILGVSAPVIAQQTINLSTYASDNSTFENGTVGNWSALQNCTIAVAAQGFHGTKSLQVTATAAGQQTRTYRVITAITSALTQF